MSLITKPRVVDAHHYKTQKLTRPGTFYSNVRSPKNLLVHWYHTLRFQCIDKMYFIVSMKSYSNFINCWYFWQTIPRFQPENLEKNKGTFEKIAGIASRKGCSPGQLSLAWICHQGNNISPIPGTTKVKNLDQNIGALSVKITADEMKEIENVLSTSGFSGDRNWASSLKLTWVNSETPPLSSWKDAIWWFLTSFSANKAK